MFMHIEINGEELQKIFEDIEAAERTILKSYQRLEDLGVVKIQNPQSKEGTIEAHRDIEAKEL